MARGYLSLLSASSRSGNSTFPGRFSFARRTQAHRNAPRRIGLGMTWTWPAEVDGSAGMSKLPEWVHLQQASLFRHVIPFTWGPRPYPSRELEIHWGTAFAVDLGAGPLLVTARHVVEAALQALKVSNTHCMLGQHEVALRLEDVLWSATLDACCLPITSRLKTRFEWDYTIVRPPDWPPPELTLYDPVVFIGFPQNWPVVSSWQDVDFRAVTSLALVHRVRTDEFICQLDPAYVEQYLN
jgi:hypothetical protein